MLRASSPADRTIDRTIIRLAVPALGTLAVEPLYVTVDTAIVGHLGTAPLAGLAVASQVLVVVVSLCNFLAYGTTERIAFHRGAGRFDQASLVAFQAIWAALAIGFPLAVVVALTADPVSSLLGADGAAHDAATTYLRISAVSIPAVLITLVAHGVLRAEQRLRGLLVVVVVANIVNVVFEVVAVYVLDLGIAGSAWSTVAVQAISVAAYLWLLLPVLRTSPARSPIPAEMVRLLRVGGFLVARVAALMFTFTTATAVAARIDEATLAAHQILASGFLLLALSLDALAIPGQSMVAAALGGGDRAGAAHIARRVVSLSLRCGLVLAAVTAAGSPWIPQLFSSDEAVRSRAASGALMLAVLLIPGALAFGLDGILIGAGRFRSLSTMMIKVLAVYVPTIAIALVVPGVGVVGIWFALTAWMVGRAWFGWRLAARDLWAA